VTQTKEKAIYHLVERPVLAVPDILENQLVLNNGSSRASAVSRGTNPPGHGLRLSLVIVIGKWEAHRSSC
jgi:hypothetical protein